MKNLFFIAITLFFMGNIRSQESQPVNIILMVGDGMGLGQITYGSYLLDGPNVFKEFKDIGLVETYSEKRLITDSAASATAFATGEKTYNGVVGISPKNQKLESILKICKRKGYNTGIVVTSTIVHATPAAFYANHQHRGDYYKIANQLSKSSEVDYFIGGGKKYFTHREDNQNLLKKNMSEYYIAPSLEKFNASNSIKGGYFFSNDEPMSLGQGRFFKLEEGVESVLNKLDQRKEPFFLVVEGSQIDWGGHKNDSNYIGKEFKEFHRAIKVAVEYSKKNENTLVIVTADHETGGLAITGGKINSYGKISPFGINTSFISESHTGTMVPLFAMGPYAELFRGVYDNTDIFKKMLITVERSN